MVYHTAAGKVIEPHRSYCILSKYSVVMMLLIVVTSLVGISSVYQPAETQLLQPALASPPPEVVAIQLPPIPPLLPPGGPTIDLPGLPPIQPPPSQ